MNYFDSSAAAASYAKGRPYYHHLVIKRFRDRLKLTAKLGKALDDLPVPRSVTSLGSVKSTHVELLGICTACAGLDQTGDQT